MGIEERMGNASAQPCIDHEVLLRAKENELQDLRQQALQERFCIQQENERELNWQLQLTEDAEMRVMRQKAEAHALQQELDRQAFECWQMQRQFAEIDAVLSRDTRQVAQHLAVVAQDRRD